MIHTALSGMLPAVTPWWLQKSPAFQGHNTRWYHEEKNVEMIGLYCYIGTLAWSFVSCFGPGLIPVEQLESRFFKTED
jgi:hypothetical protein